MENRTIQEIADLFAAGNTEKNVYIRSKLTHARQELDIETVDNYREGGKYLPAHQLKLVEYLINQGVKLDIKKLK